ncbi:MAG: phage recombination protein Bet, partial [Anaerocolumna sp.]|nr:phage recombination protein Bet [Anaerocolumna sp.]
EAYPEEFEGLYVAEEMNVDDKDLNTEPVDVEKELEKENEVPEQPKPVQKEQKQYLMQLGAQKGLVIGEGKEADVSKLEALANENNISLRGLTYESANTLLKIVEEYEEIVDVETTPANDDPGPDAPPEDPDDADPF